jgi:hypothetical protein
MTILYFFKSRAPIAQQWGAWSGYQAPGVKERKKKKRELDKLEEELAIEILASRMKQDILISPEVDTQKLAKILTAKMAQQPENIDQHRRIKLLISILSMED